MLLSLLMFLPACATKTVVSEAVYPPAHLLNDCPEPVMQGDTNGALARHILDLRSALRSCNGDKQALRAWRGEDE